MNRLERDKLFSVTSSTRNKEHHVKQAGVRTKIKKTEVVLHTMSSWGSHWGSEITWVGKDAGKIHEKIIICGLLNTEESHLSQGVPEYCLISIWGSHVTWSVSTCFAGISAYAGAGKAPVWPILFSYYDFIVNLIDPQITIPWLQIFQIARTKPVISFLLHTTCIYACIFYYFPQILTCNCHISFNSAHLYIVLTLLSLTGTLTLIAVNHDDTIGLSLYF